MKVKDIRGYEDKYQITDDGRVYDKERDRWLPIYSIGPNRRYRGVNLKDPTTGKWKMHRLHRLVAEAFIPNPDPKEKPQVNHKDEDPSNNNVDNLEWCSQRYNNVWGTRIQRATVTRRKNMKAKESIIKKEQAEMRSQYKVQETKWDRHIVLQFSLEGDYIGSWKSAVEIKRVLNLDVRKCLLCKSISCGGYIWMYKVAR